MTITCGHDGEWLVSMTSPRGETGIEIEKCTTCLVSLLYTPAVQKMGRTVHVIRKGTP